MVCIRIGETGSLLPNNPLKSRLRLELCERVGGVDVVVVVVVVAEIDVAVVALDGDCNVCEVFVGVFGACCDDKFCCCCKDADDDDGGVDGAFDDVNTVLTAK